MKIKRPLIIGRDPIITIALIRALNKKKESKAWKI
jgi:hypothetical protein